MGSLTSLQKNNGFSLVELLVSIVIGLFILAGATQILLDGRRSYSVQEELSYLQNNGRFIKDVLARDIKMAGYEGCGISNMPLVNTLRPPANDEYKLGRAISGSQHNGTAWEPALAGEWTSIAGIDTNSDILELSGIFGAGMRLARAMVNPSAVLKVQQPATLQDEEIFFVTDCKRAAIAQVTNITTTGGSGVDNLVHNPGGSTSPGNTNDPLTSGTPFGTDASVYRFELRRYYIAPSNISDTQALWRKTNLDAANELVSGVESLQVQYGVDTTIGSGADDAGDGGANRYLEADSIVNDVAVTPTWIGWDRVQSVKITLVLRSDREVHSENTSVTLDGVAYNDRYLRQRISFTTRVRNSGLNAP